MKLIKKYVNKKMCRKFLLRKSYSKLIDKKIKTDSWIDGQWIFI